METQSTVLVAEDSKTQALQIQWMLEKSGFHVVMTANGKEALASIRQSLPHIVVTDLEMPEMNGLELVEAVHAEFPKLPVVLATALGSEVVAAEALRKEAASYVPKRFLKDLAPTLTRLLAAAEADRTSTQLAVGATHSELKYCLTNDSKLNCESCQI